MARYLLVGLGGFLGAISRYWLGAYVGERLGVRFPYGTFIINMSGCLLIGIVMTVLDQRAHWSPAWRYLVPIGFIGAYTTFSTFEFETLRGVQEGALMTAALNVVLSVVLGFAAVWLGIAATKAVLNVRPATSEVGKQHSAELARSAAAGQDFAAEPEG